MVHRDHDRHSARRPALSAATPSSHFARVRTVRAGSPFARGRAMKIFVAGATGVIGRRAVPALIQAGHEVTAIGRTRGRRAALEEIGAKTVDVSLFDRGG